MYAIRSYYAIIAILVVFFGRLLRAPVLARLPRPRLPDALAHPLRDNPLLQRAVVPLIIVAV